VVAEAAFQDRLWRPGLEPLVDLADIRVLRCVVDPELARERIAHRAATQPARLAHVGFAGWEHCSTRPEVAQQESVDGGFPGI
jgi:hypothetical protein